MLCTGAVPARVCVWCVARALWLEREALRAPQIEPAGMCVVLAFVALVAVSAWGAGLRFDEPVERVGDCDAPRRVVVFLHGLRESHRDPFDRVGAFADMGARLRVCFVLPVSTVVDDGVWGWYTLTDINFRAPDTLKHYPVAMAYVRALLSSIRQRHPDVPLCLAGFSQGAALALAAASDGPGVELEGVLAFSGYGIVSAPPPPATRVFVVHHPRDHVLPYDFAMHLYAPLRLHHSRLWMANTSIRDPDWPHHFTVESCAVLEAILESDWAVLERSAQWARELWARVAQLSGRDEL